MCESEFASRKELISHISRRILIKNHKFLFFCHQLGCIYKSQFDTLPQLHRHLVTQEDRCNQQLSKLMHTTQHLIVNSISNNCNNDDIDMEEPSYSHENGHYHATSEPV